MTDTSSTSSESSASSESPLSVPDARSTLPPEALVEQALFQVKRAVVGQDAMLERLMACALAGGHCLLEGPPGLAKTLAAKSMATVLGGTFTRIQFTPDLLPADIVGTRIYKPSRETFDIELGPVFANIVLADEINRASPKVQSALLEVMAEGQVSIGGHSYAVPSPFMVLATQNPIESEGVYALPEAQQDRFLMKVLIGYPTDREEHEIVHRVSVKPPQIQELLSVEQWDGLRTATSDVFVHDAIVDYAVRIVAATRRPAEFGLGDLADYISYGASPRATLGLVSAARAMALMRGRTYAHPNDVYAIAADVLRHRIVLSYDALAADVTVEAILARLLQTVRPPNITPNQSPAPTATAGHPQQATAPQHPAAPQQAYPAAQTAQQPPVR
ncbi:MAG: MoxR family ATPase [Actinobacteria bacterium]|nr:MoxR family ATPase [Actinomycetota bacterium]